MFTRNIITCRLKIKANLNEEDLKEKCGDVDFKLWREAFDNVMAAVTTKSKDEIEMVSFLPSFMSIEVVCCIDTYRIISVYTPQLTRLELRNVEVFIAEEETQASTGLATWHIILIVAACLMLVITLIGLVSVV